MREEKKEEEEMVLVKPLRAYVDSGILRGHGRRRRGKG